MLHTLQKAIKYIAPCAMLAGAGASFSHDGHSLQGSHWHATDLWGFVALGVLLAVAVWQGRK